MFFRETFLFGKLKRTIEREGDDADAKSSESILSIADKLLDRNGDVPQSVNRRVNRIAASWKGWGLPLEEREKLLWVLSGLALTTAIVLDLASKKRKRGSSDEQMSTRQIVSSTVK